MAIDLAAVDTAARLMPGVKANESGDAPDDQVPPGDGGKSRGAYQVSAGALDDVNKAFGTSYAPADLDKPAVNKDVAQKYLTLQVQRFGPRVGLEAYNAGPTRVAAGDVPQSSVDYAARALNVGGAGGGMDQMMSDYPKFQAMLGKPDASWLAPTLTALRANQVAEKAELEGINRQTETDYTADRARAREAYDASNKDDTTPWNKPPPPREALEGFASAGSIFAAIASAFTRTPAISAMNGMAAAINARRDGNQKAYDDAYKVWQDNTKLAVDRQKMASDRLSQAMQMMTTDIAHGTALARQVMTEHGDERGLLMLEAGEYQKLDEANQARDRTAANMAIQASRLGASGMTWSKEQALLIEQKVAQGMPRDQAMKEVSELGKTGSAAADKEKDAKALALAAFKEKHDGRDPGPADAAEMAALTTAQRQRASALSGRNAIMIGRSLTSAMDATSDLKNVVELPITIDTGMFGGRRQGPGLMAATKEILANTVTAEDAQAYNTAMAGLERSLGGLATGGLAVSDNVMHQFGQLKIEKGDTNLIKLRKIATMRQNVDNGLDGLLSNPQLGDDQRKQIEDLKTNLATFVPWTVHDVNQLEFSKDPNLTVAQFAKAKGVGGSDAAPLPPKEQLKAGTVYQTPRGPAKWDGTHFIPQGQ